MSTRPLKSSDGTKNQLDVAEQGHGTTARDSFFSVRILWPVCRLAQQLGCDSRQLLKDAGMTERQLREPEGRVQAAKAFEVLQLAIERTADPDFGLHVGEVVHPSDFGLRSYLADTCSTVREMLLCLNRFSALVSDIEEWFLDVDEDVARWGFWLPEWLPINRHYVEATFAGMLAVGRKAYGGSQPLAVEFRHSEPADTRELERVFGCALRFDCPVDAIVLRSHVLDLPKPYADPQLHARLVAHAEQLLPRYRKRVPISQQVRELLAEELTSGNPTLDRTAGKLHMSSSTLRRRLRDSGTTHRQVLDELRRDLALRYLQQPDLSVSEVGYRLGFAQINNFYRAFKRWTGCSPLEYQRRHATQAIPMRFGTPENNTLAATA